jgi:PAS domain S-box-containing protein
MDRDFRITYANPEARRLSRLSDKHLCGPTIWEIYPNIAGTPIETTYRQVLANGIPQHIEYFHPPFNLWIDLLIQRYEDGILLHYDDITALKQAQAREQTTAQRLAQVLDVTSDAVVTIDRSWRIGFLNKRARQIIDPHDRLLGAHVWTEFPASVGTASWEIYHRSMDDGLPGHAEVYSGAPINLWLSIHSQPTPDGIVVFFRDITEQKAHDELIRRQQELLAVVQQVSRVAAFEIDLTTSLVSYGPSSFEVYGRPFDQLRTLDDFRAIREPRSGPIVERAVAQALASMAPTTVEFEVFAPGGQGTIWVESRFQAIAVDGAVRYLRGITIDVTERKRNEAVLVASEARYRALTELNPTAVWMADATGNIIYANQITQDYTGIIINEHTGLAWLAAFPPEDQSRLMEVWAHSVTTGTDYDLRVPMRRAFDGVYRWWQLRAQPVRDPAGTIQYWLGIAFDIHESITQAETLKRQHEEAERQRVELEAVYQTAPIGLALFDAREFRYLRLNETQAEIVGLPRERVLGRTLTEIAPIEGLQEMFQEVAQGKPIRNQLIQGELPTRPGEHRYWTVNYFPVYGPDGTVQAITAASLEITHQKRAEDALIQSEKLAAVGRLASSISHEINNPLEAITNLLYLIAHATELAQDTRRYVEVAQAELSRVSQIATQTLRFHRQAVAPTAVSAAELVDAVVDLYQGRLANSGIHVETCYHSTSQIVCFENDIRQVLNNLIANAIDAMRAGGGRLVLRAHDTHAPDGRPGVRITVADTGHGMPPAVVERIFEPFFTTKDLNGTGLGLWISEGIVQRHHGRLTLRSTTHPIHHGTIFSLFLPQQPASVPDTL